MSTDKPSEPTKPGDEGDSGKDEKIKDGARGFAAFRYTDFRIFYFGKLFCVASYHMTLVAVAYHIYEVSSSALSLALVNLSMIGPVIGLALLVGYIIDSVDRRKVLLFCYWIFTASAASMCVVTVLGVTSLWPFYLILFAVGIGRAFFGPSSNAIVPNLVPREVFPNAVAWNTSAGKTAQICGPVIGGFMYLLGPEIVYGIAAFMFLCAALTASMISPLKTEKRSGGMDIKSLLVGVVYVLEKKIILGSLVLDLLTALMGGVAALLPIFARDILEVGAAGAGVLRSSIALGGLAAALYLTHISINRRAGAVMLVGTAIFGISTALFGLSTSYPLSIFILAIVGASEVVNANVRQTLFQIATPDSVRGRVSAVSSISSTMGTELGGFRAGAFASVIGAPAAVVVGGLIVIAAAAASPKIFPQLSRVQRMDRAL